MTRPGDSCRACCSLLYLCLDEVGGRIEVLAVTIRQRGVVVAEARFDDRLTLFTAEGGTIVNGYVGIRTVEKLPGCPDTEFTLTPAMAPVSLSSSEMLGTSFSPLVETVVADPVKADLRVAP